MPIVKNTRSFLLSAVSGALLILIFPRFDYEFIAWFALVPLLMAIQDESPAKASSCGFIAGTTFYFFGLVWIVNTMVNYGKLPPALSFPILGLLAAYLGFYVALFCYLLRRWCGDRPLYAFMLAPVLWTSLEYVRSTHLEYGFSWLGLGYSQHLNLPVIQIAEYTGVYGVTALIVLVNAALSYLINSWLSLPPEARRLYPTGFRVRVAASVLLTVALCLGFGWSALQRKPPDGPPLRIVLAQGNIEQGIKWDQSYKQQVMETYENLTLGAATTRPDLIVWPEAATPYYFNIDADETGLLLNLVRETQTPLLFGSPYYERNGSGITSYNSAYLLSAEGIPQGRYDKIHLVPFGEFVPLQKLLWFVQKMAEGVGNFGRGKQATMFDLNGTPFGVSICYEIIFPDLVRRPVKNGARFLVNITNDAWFGRSAASYQHIAMAALRATENRVPIVRAANTGISGVIDPTGQIRDTTDLFVEDAVLAEIKPSQDGPTFYARHGDVFSYACIVITLSIGLFARTRKEH